MKLEHKATGQAERYAQSWQEGTYGGRGESSVQGSTPLLESFIEHLKRGDELDSRVPIVFEGGAGSGDHSIRLVQEGFYVIANEYSGVAATRIHEKARNQLGRCTIGKLAVAKGDIVRWLREKDLTHLDGFYANSLLHTFSAEERLTIYEAVHRIQPSGGLIAVSFKAEGDGVQHEGKNIDETEAGDIVEDKIGISRLFVRNPEPLIEELARAGYKHLETLTWDVPKYIAVRTYDSSPRKFVGLLVQKK
ncbi:hypothetical protein HYX12_02220 [Candidatus Woesearchaeota archaeon]|nr:hypothetical protein [Candidatus Woesearchaeota archaeon]